MPLPHLQFVRIIDGIAIALLFSLSTQLHGQESKVAADVKILSVVRPWVADEVGLTQEQRTKVLAVVVEFQNQIKATREKFNKGKMSEYAPAQMQDFRARAVVAVQAELTDLQIRQTLQLDSKGPSSLGEVFKEEAYSSASLFDMPAIDSLNLTTGQQARYRALLMQAEDDLQNETEDTDKKRNELHDELAAMLQDMLGAKVDFPTQGRLKYEMKFSDSWTYKRAAKVAMPNHFRAVNGLSSMTYGIARKQAGQAEIVLWHSEDVIIDWVAHSPDKKWIVTLGLTFPGLGVGEMRLWDADSGRLVDSLPVGKALTNAKRGGSGFLHHFPYQGFVRFLSSQQIQVLLDEYSERSREIAP